MRIARTATFALLLAALLLSAAPAAFAKGGVGGLKFQGCLSGKRAVTIDPRTPREGGCRPSSTVALDADGSAMRELRTLVASPDGRSLYGVTPAEDAVTAFRTKPFGFAECFSGIVHLRRHGAKVCHTFPHAGTEDSATGFNGVFSATISRDGRSLYTVSSDDHSIGIFSRAPSGKLTYRGCLTGDVSKESAGRSGACKAIPTATDIFGGTYSGLAGPSSLAVSPDGRFVYAALAGEAGIAILARGADGSLSYVSCLRGASQNVYISGSSGPPCPLVAPEAENPSGSGLRGVRSLAISPDGSSLYASSPGRGAVAEFSRDAATGALDFIGCIGSATRGSGPNDPCSLIPTAGEIPSEGGIWGLKDLVVSADGRNVYGVAGDDESIVQFSRDLTTGALSYMGCITGNSSIGEFGDGKPPCTEIPGASKQGFRSGLLGPVDIALSPDGRRAFVAARGDNSIAVFARTPITGALSWKGCLTNSPKVIAHASGCKLIRVGRHVQLLGLNGLDSLAIAGHSLYASAGNEGAISRFSVGG